MDAVRKSLMEAFHDRVSPARSVGLVVSLLKYAPVTDYPADLRCLMLGVLKKSLLADQTLRQYHVIKAIRHLQNATGFSQKLLDWLDGGMDLLVGFLENRNGLQRKLDNWKNLDLATRFDLLDYIQRWHLRIYGGPLRPARAGILNDDTAFSGLAHIDLDPPPAEDRDIQIGFNVIALENPGEALDTIHHEATHNAIVQLARAWMGGDIAPDDPLAPDAQLAFCRARYESYMPLAIRAAYDNDPEEIIATTEGKKFAARMDFPSPA